MQLFSPNPFPSEVLQTSRRAQRPPPERDIACNNDVRASTNGHLPVVPAAGWSNLGIMFQSVFLLPASSCKPQDCE